MAASSTLKNLLVLAHQRAHRVAGVVDYVVKVIERDLPPRAKPFVRAAAWQNQRAGGGRAVIRTIHNIALNPNFGGEVMVIGLGCENCSRNDC